MGWIARCQAGSSSSRAFEDAEEADNGGTSQLEVNIISAQDVKRERYVGQMQAYAVAWIKQDYKLRTHVVDCDDLHPAWNVRLHFIVSDALFSQEKGTHSALTIELYCQGRLRDTLLGTVRILLSTLSRKGKGYHGAQSLALQIRRPSGRPQGILNIGSLILDLDASLMNVPPLLTSPYLFEDDHHKLGKFAPLREFQEICRRSFSVSRDDLLSKEKLPSTKFALDDNSLQKHASLALTEALSEDEDEEDLAMDAIYKKLKALAKCNAADHDDSQNKRIEHVSTKPVDDDDDAQDEITGHVSTKSVEPIKQNEDTIKEASRKGYNDQLSTPKLFEGVKAAMGSVEKLEGKHFDKGNQLMGKLNNEAMYKESNEFARLYQDGFVDKSASKKQGSLCEDGVIKVNKIGDSVVFLWKDLPLHKKKELFCDELIGKEDAFCRKPNNLSIWAKRASWALKKGAAKIHLSPSDK